MVWLAWIYCVTFPLLLYNYNEFWDYLLIPRIDLPIKIYLKIENCFKDCLCVSHLFSTIYVSFIVILSVSNYFKTDMKELTILIFGTDVYFN